MNITYAKDNMVKTNKGLEEMSLGELIVELIKLPTGVMSRPENDARREAIVKLIDSEGSDTEYIDTIDKVIKAQKKHNEVLKDLSEKVAKLTQETSK